jgi:hypothetical protein
MWIISNELTTTDTTDKSYYCSLGSVTPATSSSPLKSSLPLSSLAFAIIILPINDPTCRPSKLHNKALIEIESQSTPCY